MGRKARLVEDRASIIQPPVETPVVEETQNTIPPVPGMDAETEDDLLRIEAMREVEKIKASRVEVPKPIVKSEDTASFVKNGFTQEIIKFEDGSTFSFGRKALFVTDDKSLIKKLRAVAENYGILEQY